MRFLWSHFGRDNLNLAQLLSSLARFTWLGRRSGTRSRTVFGRQTAALFMLHGYNQSFVKPRIFIGSSASAKGYASAIHVGLAGVAACTVWTDGAFALSTSTMAALLKNLRDSDFGIFVFAPDDTATIKGELLNVPRDNVVYEAGLFSGYLCPERCFIVAPQTVKVHVPSDLLGMTLGFMRTTEQMGTMTPR
jgi:predicted nucleotide-binding protein